LSLDPKEYRILMQYRDKMLANMKNPDKPAVPIYDAANPPDFPDLHLGAANAEGSFGP
jgi:hypothetical protein